MTKPKYPVVKALERINQKNYITGGGYYDHETRQLCSVALPLVRELVEYKEGLEWLKKEGWLWIMFGHLDDTDCPAIIKRMIGERHD